MPNSSTTSAMCRVPLAKLLQHLHQRFGLGHDQRLSHDVRQMKGRRVDGRARMRDAAFVPDPQHVFEKDRADDLFRLFFPDRQARMLALDHRVEHFVERGVGRHRHNLAARLHDFAHIEIVEIEHAMDHVFLQLGEVAGKPAGADDELEFLGRVPSAAVAGLDAEQTRECPRRTFDHGDEDRHQTVEHHQRRRHDYRQPVGLVDGQILRHHFADHHVAVSHHDERQHKARRRGEWWRSPRSEWDGTTT